MARETGPSKQKEKRKLKKDKADKELKKVLDAELATALDENDDHHTRVELLLTQIVIELKNIGKK